MVYDKTREEAIGKMSGVLDELIIEGIDTNTKFLYDLIQHPDFHKGKIDTGFVERVIAK